MVDHQYLLECLARDIIKRTSEKQQSFMMMFEKKNGKAVTERLEKIIKTEKEKARHARRSGVI